LGTSWEEGGEENTQLSDCTIEILERANLAEGEGTFDKCLLIGGVSNFFWIL